MLLHPILHLSCILEPMTSTCLPPPHDMSPSYGFYLGFPISYISHCNFPFSYYISYIFHTRFSIYLIFTLRHLFVYYFSWLSNFLQLNSVSSYPLLHFTFLLSSPLNSNPNVTSRPRAILQPFPLQSSPSYSQTLALPNWPPSLSYVHILSPALLSLAALP